MRYEAYRGFRLLPPGTRKDSQYWYARGRLHGREREVSLKCTDADDAKRIIDQILLTPALAEPCIEFMCIRGPLPNWANKLRLAASYRSTANDIPFTLTREDMRYLVKRASGRCEVSGIPFSDTRYRPVSRRRPFAPSLDRIDPGAGYTMENCRLVLFAVNVAMSDWGEDVFALIANHYTKHKVQNT